MHTNIYTHGLYSLYIEKFSLFHASFILIFPQKSSDHKNEYVYILFAQLSISSTHTKRTITIQNVRMYIKFKHENVTVNSTAHKYFD